MLLRRYSYIDLYYNDNEVETKKALKERKRLIASGYELMVEDSAGGHDKETGRGFDFCDQFLKDHASREIIPKE